MRVESPLVKRTLFDSCFTDGEPIGEPSIVFDFSCKLVGRRISSELFKKIAAS